jgi:dihydrolipoamide dehydrogenase
MNTRLAVIGAGPGGYVAAFHAADLGMQVTLIDADPNPGGVCTFRGCIPSKALLHAARVLDEAKHATAYGVSFGKPSIDVDKLRAWKDHRCGRSLRRDSPQLTRTTAAVARSIRTARHVGSFP